LLSLNGWELDGWRHPAENPSLSLMFFCLLRDSRGLYFFFIATPAMRHSLMLA
jgi:hypothetical protein